jgi:hypothetical protein
MVAEVNQQAQLAFARITPGVAITPETAFSTAPAAVDVLERARPPLGSEMPPEATGPAG